MVRADDLQWTDISRMLYVELLTPDGFLVNRQIISLDPNDGNCGDFVLDDSLYAGYYEIRAYTKWMLNFGEYQHKHNSYNIDDFFFNKKIVKDYYRDYDKLYSRVFPVYNKPDTAGGYIPG